jgi:hypothetical protein
MHAYVYVYVHVYVHNLVSLIYVSVIVAKAQGSGLRVEIFVKWTCASQ